MLTINNVIIEGLGCNNRKYTVLHGLSTNSTILNVKNMIYDRFNIPTDIYYFIYQSRHVDDETELNALKFKGDDTLHVRFRSFNKIQK